MSHLRVGEDGVPGFSDRAVGAMVYEQKRRLVDCFFSLSDAEHRCGRLDIAVMLEGP